MFQGWYIEGLIVRSLWRLISAFQHLAALTFAAGGQLGLHWLKGREEKMK